MGSAALYHLARRGRRVLGLERFDVLHEHGSSHGLTRIIRLAYFEHPDYVPLLRRAYELWRELESEAGEQLLRITGILEGGGPILDGVLRSCAEHDLRARGAERRRGRASVSRIRAARRPRRRPPTGRGLPRPGALHRRARRGRARERSRAAGAGARPRVGGDRERRPHSHGPRKRRGGAPRSHRRRVVRGRRAADGRLGPSGSASPRVVPADAPGALPARPHAGVQPHPRRGALLRLSRARDPGREARSLRAAGGERRPGRDLARADARRRERRCVHSRSATCPRAPAPPSRSRRASSSSRRTSTS